MQKDMKVIEKATPVQRIAPAERLHRPHDLPEQLPIHLITKQPFPRNNP